MELFHTDLTLSEIGSWASIISLIITTVLAFFARSLRGKLQRAINFTNFKSDKSSLLKDLISTRDLLVLDETNEYELDNILELSEILRRLSDYKSYMKMTDKYALWKVRRIISKGDNKKNKKQLISCISTLVGFLKTRIEIDIKNL